MDPHRTAELTSRELHRAVVARLRDDPGVLAVARRRVGRWLGEGTVHHWYAERWRDLLDGPLEALCAPLVADTEEARALRQVSPFAGALDPRTRWRIWRSVRRGVEESA